MSGGDVALHGRARVFPRKDVYTGGRFDRSRSHQGSTKASGRHFVIEDVNGGGPLMEQFLTIGRGVVDAGPSTAARSRPHLPRRTGGTFNLLPAQT